MSIEATEFAHLDEFDYETLPPELSRETGQVTYVVQVRLEDVNRVVAYDAADLQLQRRDAVVLETERGLSMGTVVTEPQCVRPASPLPRILRRAEEGDLRQQERNVRREEEAFRYCWERIRERRLPMKLIRVSFLHGGNKAVFYFSADGRIDFRELVKDLAYRLHTRVEMRQIGVRDASKMVGGVGICGRELCCSSWLQRFEPVSIRMAKIQNLSLNPQKVSGLCGRLMCCLAYEQDTYQTLRKRLPRVGKTVETSRGEGRVVEIDILALRARVRFEDGSVVEFEANQVRLLGDPQGETAVDEIPPELLHLDDQPEGNHRGAIPARGREVRSAGRGGRRKPWQEGRSTADKDPPPSGRDPRGPRRPK